MEKEWGVVFDMELKASKLTSGIDGQGDEPASKSSCTMERKGHTHAPTADPRG